jgi:hypothetical protein
MCEAIAQHLLNSNPVLVRPDRQHRALVKVVLNRRTTPRYASHDEAT